MSFGWKYVRTVEPLERILFREDNARLFGTFSHKEGDRGGLWGWDEESIGRQLTDAIGSISQIRKIAFSSSLSVSLQRFQRIDRRQRLLCVCLRFDEMCCWVYGKSWDLLLFVGCSLIWSGWFMFHFFMTEFKHCIVGGISIDGFSRKNLEMIVQKD